MTWSSNLSLIATWADATVQGVEDTTKDTTTVETKTGTTAGTTAGITAGIRIIKETTLAVTCTNMVIQIITSNQIEDGRNLIYENVAGSLVPWEVLGMCE